VIVENRKVVAFHYTLTNDRGEELESSRERQPMSYLHGAHNILPGLEKALAGKSAGDRLQVTLPPAEAYGERDPSRLQRIPAKHFTNPRAIRPGEQITLKTRQGQVPATVVKVGRFNIDIDSNHPLAGQTLTFDLEITDVREASAEEIAHGHAHEGGGHHH
jgi:FKBP-type peptidyl-prolyl cis-trans isomerase SlyD